MECVRIRFSAIEFKNSASNAQAQAQAQAQIKALI
jgi:hypothetical protein